MKRSLRYRVLAQAAEHAAGQRSFEGIDGGPDAFVERRARQGAGHRFRAGR
jgi:hypothetical protein